MISNKVQVQYSIRAADMVRKMKLCEKISQLRHHSKALPKHKIPEYNWWNECLHGVARAGLATVFPQAIALAATFCENILYTVGDIISTEARAKHDYAKSKNDFGIYKGLTFWSPNINIFRDPRWGRGQETYGEDPYLTSILGVAFIRGLQGDDDKYLKVSACAKHFAAHSGPEAERHSFNAMVSKKDLYETYLPAFESAVKIAKVESVMTAYNRLNDEACSTSNFLIKNTLRRQWQFKGHVVSDCGAIPDIIFRHKMTLNPLKCVAIAVKNGLDLECGTYFSLLPIAVKLGYIKETFIDTALTRLLTTRIKLGMFDDDCKYSDIPIDKVACSEHEDYAIEVAEKGIVLLKNNGILPLTLKTNTQVALFGYNAKNPIAYLGNYSGTPSSFINTYDGLSEVLGDSLIYNKAFPLCGKLTDKEQLDFSASIKIAKDSDYIIICTGLDSTLEGEAGDTGAGSDGIIGKQGDRSSINLPQCQLDFINSVSKLKKKIVILNFSGSCISFSAILHKVDAIMQCWYPGAKGGKAIANLLFGKTSPSGRLPITFYQNDTDLGDFYDYSMKNRTYRYFGGKPLFPFGYGLSYTNFEYSNFVVDDSSNESFSTKVTIKNNGLYDSDEVVQLYLKYPVNEQNQPRLKLIKTKRINIKSRGEVTLHFTLTKNDFNAINIDGDKILFEGKYHLHIGGGQPNFARTLIHKICF